MKVINKIAFVLLVVGGLNWGLVGIFNFDLVAMLFGGAQSAIAKLVYTLVGISAVLTALSCSKCTSCKIDDTKPMSNMPTSGM